MQKNTNSPMISIPLDKFLFILFGYSLERENVEYNYDEDIPALLQLLDPSESRIHIEQLGSDTIIWQIKPWRVSYERELLKKRQMAERVAAWNRMKNILSDIAERCRCEMGLDDDEAEQLARKIYKGKKYKLAISLGYSGDMEWEDL